MTDVHPRWKALLEWLGEKGMTTSSILVEPRKTPGKVRHKLHEINILMYFLRYGLGAGYGLFALREIPPSTPLFKVPAKAMINIHTLVGLYPKARPKLTATQIMSLHLFLHRPGSSNCLSKDNIFGPYISILPSDFDAHPLAWLIRPRDPLAKREDLEIGHDLLEHIPKGVLDSLEKVADRFREDWGRVSQYLVS